MHLCKTLELCRTTSIIFLVEAIRSSVLSVANRAREGDTVTSIDDDFLLEVFTSETGVWYHVALWIGEPYVLMRGYRFTADRESIMRFVEDLKSIEGTVS